VEKLCLLEHDNTNIENFSISELTEIQLLEFGSCKSKRS